MSCNPAARCTKPPPCEEPKEWVRRSTRTAGSQQLDRRDLTVLLRMMRLQDPALRILRLKNWITSDINTQTMAVILDAMEKCAVVEVLYIQNFEKGMDDERLLHLTRVLERGA